MKKLGYILLFLVSLPLAAQDKATTATLSDEQVKEAIISESIANYSGNCPCPYNHASNGSMCGKRSAWSKPGGYDPICYKNEISQEMVDEWKTRNKK
jgi:hypothetical protein